MGWDDIDFDFIIPGAATFAQQVAFGEYFNAFGVALDERQALIGDPLNGIELSGIRFEAGEITNDVFYDKLRDMIEGYNDIWFNFFNEFYEVGVLTDVLNPNDYLISDADLETAMGAEAYDILVNWDSMSNQQIFKASLFTGLYEFYKLTFYVKKSILKTDSNSIVNNVPNYFTDATYEQGVGGGDSFEIYNEALNFALNDYTPTTPLRGNNTFSAWIDTDQRRFSGVGNDKWRVEFEASQDYLAYSVLSKDLDDVVLTMDYTIGPLIVRDNRAGDSSTVPTTITTYTNKYPLASLDNILAPTVIESTLQDNVRGSIQEQYIKGNKGADIPVLPPMANKTNTPPTSRTAFSDFLTFIPQISYIDLNNSALEFYISP